MIFFFKLYTFQTLKSYGEGSNQAEGEDLLLRFLCADMPGRAQEEAPGHRRQLLRVLQEMRREMEGKELKAKQIK